MTIESDGGAANAVLAEIRKTRETADRLANGDYPEGADHIRALAGMVKQLADQMERLADLSLDRGASDTNDRPEDGSSVGESRHEVLS